MITSPGILKRSTPVINKKSKNYSSKCHLVEQGYFTFRRYEYLCSFNEDWFNANDFKMDEN